MAGTCAPMLKIRGSRVTGIVIALCALAVITCASAFSLDAQPRASAASHWAFQPLRRPAVPAIQNPKSKVQNPIDVFVISRLTAKGLTLSPGADRRTLIRRLNFDLIGLPPTPEELDSFLVDRLDKAYEKLVDRLLASPHYGERWGRHWLDVARYADSDGREGDRDRLTAYHYRDFVIKALNEDMPFDRFVRWQLAGDEYEPDNLVAIAATGFIIAGPHAVLPGNLLGEEKIRERYNDLDDMISTTGQAFLALTAGCARCHDHKYDPISIRDYYQLAAIFNSADRGEAPRIPHREIAKWQKEQAEWMAELEAAKKEKNAAKVKEIEARKSSTPTTYAMIDLGPNPAESWLLERGNMFAKKEKVQMGFISSLTRNRTVTAYWEAAKAKGIRTDTSYQRMALADWITNLKDGPGALLARVAVNRLWQNHFGEGLVRTVNDFGRRADPPTHPELLEWLAAELVNPSVKPEASSVKGSGSERSTLNAQRWSLKHIHRLIVTSDTYRQSSVIPQSAIRNPQSIDPENRLLWRRRPWRIESEAYRDSMLAIAGTLNREMFGPAFKPPIPPEAMLARNVQSPYPADAKDSPETRRRTVYMFTKRVIPVPLLQVFDGPDASASCGRRNVTTVAPQALAVLNEPFVRLRSEEFAKRLILEAGKDASGQIQRAYRLALGRPPTARELNSSRHFLEVQVRRRAERDKAADPNLLALTDFAQVLFGLNEFLYVD